MSDSVIIDRNQEVEDKLSRIVYEYFAITKGIDKNKTEKVKKIICNYVNSYYSNVRVNQLNDHFFKRFYCAYLPETNRYLSNNELNELSEELLIFAKYIEKKHGLNNLATPFIKAVKGYKKEVKRIYSVTRELRKYSVVPVLCWDPFIIDINCYKNMKKQEMEKDKYVVYNYGLFVLDEIINSNLIFIRNNSVKEFYKIKVDPTLASWMEKGDIAHMSLKRRLFATSWEIIKVKTYYNAQGKSYVFAGGKPDEKI